MSIQKVLAPELSIRDYVAQLGINPENVYYQSVQSRNVSTTNAQWTITSPNKRSYLLAYSVIDWQPTLTKQTQAEADEVFGASVNLISMKPVLPFANAMSSATLSINGNTLTLSQPRRFMEQLTWSNVSRDEAEICYETGYPTDMGGQVNTINPGKAADNVSNDDTWLKNESSLSNKILKAGGNTSYGAVGNDVTISHQEPQIIPPFNPFAKLKAGMPDYMWFKSMSDVIPNIDRLEFDYQFTKLSDAVLYPRYMQDLVVGAEFKHLKITDLDANMKLWWYEVPVNTSIPAQVDLQTWNVREFQSNVTVVADGALVTNGTRSDLIQLNSTPTLIVVSIRRDQDNALYRSRAVSSSDDFKTPPTATSIANAGIHSWDSYQEITSLEVLLGDRPNVISTNFTQRELYQLTLKNSKTPYPYNFGDWASKRRITTDLNGLPLPAVAWNDYGAKCAVVLRPKDLAEKISDGVFAPNSIQIVVNSRARDGFAGIPTPVNQTYRMYVHLYFGKHFLRLEPDRAQFQEQSIPLDEARRLTNPVLQSQGVSGLGAGLSGVRRRAESGFGNGVRSRL